MTTVRESSMARSGRTGGVARASCGSYSASARSDGNAGRGNPHSRPSPTLGRFQMWGPTAAGLGASLESGFPTGAGTGRVVSGTAPPGSGRPSPPLGPLPRRLPPNGGSSGGCGRAGGMIVIRPCGRSIRHDPLNATMMIATCTTALTTQVNRRNSSGGLRISNSGEDLSQPPRGLHREERARVHVVLHARERCDQLRSPGGPREPPPGHAERFGQRVELDRDVTRTRDLEDAGRHVVVERDLAVRIVVRNDNPVLATKRDRALEEFARRDRGGGSGGVV